MGYGLNGLGSIPGMARSLFSVQHPHQILGPPSLLSNGYWGWLHPGVKWPGCEADQSPSTSAKVKNTWIFTFTLPYTFIAWCMNSETHLQFFFCRIILWYIWEVYCKMLINFVYHIHRCFVSWCIFALYHSVFPIYIYIIIIRCTGICNL
jgi:hypothetical protein